MVHTQGSRSCDESDLLRLYQAPSPEGELLVPSMISYLLEHGQCTLMPRNGRCVL